MIEIRKQLTDGNGENVFHQHDNSINDELGNNIFNLLIPDHESLDSDEINNQLKSIKHDLLPKLYPNIYEIYEDVELHKMMFKVTEVGEKLLKGLDIESIDMKPVLDEFQYLSFVIMIEGLAVQHGCKNEDDLFNSMIKSFEPSHSYGHDLQANINHDNIINPSIDVINLFCQSNNESFHLLATNIDYATSIHNIPITNNINDLSLINECPGPFMTPPINNFNVIDNNLITENDDGSLSINDSIFVASTLDNQDIENGSIDIEDICNCNFD